MTDNYQWIADQLTSLQTQFNQLRVDLDTVTRDRDGLVHKLDEATERITVLEQTLADNGIDIPPLGIRRPQLYRSELQARRRRLEDERREREDKEFPPR